MNVSPSFPLDYDFGDEYMPDRYSVSLEPSEFRTLDRPTLDLRIQGIDLVTGEPFHCKLQKIDRATIIQLAEALLKSSANA